MSRGAMAAGSFAAMTTMFLGCEGQTSYVRPGAGEYSEEVALTYANLAVAAFCGHPHLPDFKALEAWNCGPACDAVPNMGAVRSVTDDAFDNAYAFVGRLGDECVVSFRGTDNSAGWLADLESGASVELSSRGIPCEWNGVKCKVGYGFLDNYLKVRDIMFGNLTEIGCGPNDGRVVSVAGHSLGAAIAVLALIDLKLQDYAIGDSYTFGQPRVGNGAFVSKLSDLLAGEAKIFRVTHYQDPVPHLPFRAMLYRHHSQEVYYAGNTTDGFKICNGGGEDISCSDQWSGVFGFPYILGTCFVGNTIKSNCDHMTYMAGLLSYNMGPESCLDPNASPEPPSVV